MPWDRSRPRSRRYDHHHQAERQRHLDALGRAGVGRCAETICVQPTRTITADMDLHLCHDPTGRVVLGLGHAQCNRAEAGRRARALQDEVVLDW